VMNPWTRREIIRAAPLRLRNPDFDHINNVFDELGPIPRLCIEYDELQLAMYRTDLTEALKKITIDKLEEIVDGGG